MAQLIPLKLGDSIPHSTRHAVSVALPTWAANVAYEKGEAWVMSKIKAGYPRFCMHHLVCELADRCRSALAINGPVMLWPSPRVAGLFIDFLRRQGVSQDIHLEPHSLTYPPVNTSNNNEPTTIYLVHYPAESARIAKAFWQHTGYGISSRLAEFCLGDCVEPVDEDELSRDGMTYLEQRYGRNLDITLVEVAKFALRKRIAGMLGDEAESNPRDRGGLSENDVYLMPTGMTAIFTAHQVALRGLDNSKKSVCFGFSYVDTLNVLQKWGPGCIFFGMASDEDLDQLEEMLKSESILALFCEFPSNPLLTCPNLQRIRKLANKHKFLVVIDDTIGNYINVHLLPYADIVVSSLTKIFSGYSNVMGGSLILNPKGQYYDLLKSAMSDFYEDIFFPEDAIFLERNSRNFIGRIHLINRNAEAVCDLFLSHPKVKTVFYPKLNSSRPYYDACKSFHGGYGGLLSVVFHLDTDAIQFYDKLRIAKGPSLGTNFTLTCPYTILAHFTELPWAAQYGVSEHLVRVSVGLEPLDELLAIFKEALND